MPRWATWLCADVLVTEEMWQPLVAMALVRTLGLRPEFLLPEVPTRDGSRADLVHVFGGRVTIFELKMADGGEAGLGLDSRAVRQLRHYREAADAVWLVTVARPRQFTLASDGRVLVHEPLERQLVPDGVGWIVFDRLGLEATVLAPAADLVPEPQARRHLCDEVLGRLGRVVSAVKECRA